MKKDDPNERERRTLGKSIRALWDAIAKSTRSTAPSVRTRATWSTCGTGES